MTLLKKLFFEQYKNLKILFRNWTSLFLLILGPLALILLIGFAYSGNELHDINLGVVSNDYNFLEKSLNNFTFATIYNYEKIEDCIYDVNMQKLHLCIEYYIRKSNSEDEIPTGTITFYFDNSKKALSSKIVDAFSDYFGNESEKISIESAKTIFANVQGLVIYLQQKSSDINLLINQSYQIKQDLIERKQRLIELREEFLPIYNKSKNLQVKLNYLSANINNSYDELNNETLDLLENLENLKKKLVLSYNKYYIVKQIYNGTNEIKYILISNISDYNENNYDSGTNNGTYFVSSYLIGRLNDLNFSIINNTLFYIENSEGNFSYDNEGNFSYDFMYYELEFNENDFLLIAIIRSIEIFEKSLLDFKEDIARYYNYTNEQKKEFDSAVKLMEDVKFMLDKDLELTEEYIIKIDYSVYSVREIQKDLDKSLIQLSKLEPGLAEKLIKPILQNFEPVKPGLENIKIAFPGMLAIIIIFISALFSNIVSLTEFNSKAFYRNKISPVNIFVFVFGLIITILLVVFLQVFVLLIVAFHRFNINVFSNLLSLFLIIFLLSLIFIFIGLIIAILIRNEQASILTTTFLVLAFFLFSDAITPLEVMPISAAFFAGKSPFVLASSLFRKILVFELGIDFNSLTDAFLFKSINYEILFLILYTLIGLALIIIFSNKLKKQ